MPNQDGSLTVSDKVTLTQMHNRIIPSDSPDLAAGSLGLLDSMQEQVNGNAYTRSAFVRVVEALSLDMMAHAVGSFATMAEDERTPKRPEDFDFENEIFGKIKVEEISTEKSAPHRRKRR